MFRTITFEIIGQQRLACQGCEERVEDLLRSVQGVKQVRARARNQRVEVLFDTAALEDTAIAERLKSAGYETKIAG
jgi:copper chaperone